MTRKRRIIAGSIAVALFLVWALMAFWIGPSEIARAHRGESLALLNDLLSGRATISLEEYLAEWTLVTSRLGWLLLVSVLAGAGIAELAASGPGRRTSASSTVVCPAGPSAARRFSAWISHLPQARG